MRLLANAALATALLTGLTASAVAETTVTLKDMHLCCGACEKGVLAAAKKVEGAQVTVDQEARTATIKAADDATARKAVMAIANAGFHGTSDHPKIKVRDNSGVKAGKVTKLELIGVHNCCGGCNKAIQETLGKVDGVKSNTAKPKSKTMVVEGDFDGQELVQALYKAGFHVRLKKEKKAD